MKSAGSLFFRNQMFGYRTETIKETLTYFGELLGRQGVDPLVKVRKIFPAFHLFI